LQLGQAATARDQTGLRRVAQLPGGDKSVDASSPRQPLDRIGHYPWLDPRWIIPRMGLVLAREQRSLPMAAHFDPAAQGLACSISQLKPTTLHPDRVRVKPDIGRIVQGSDVATLETAFADKIGDGTVANESPASVALPGIGRFVLGLGNHPFPA